MSANHTPEPWTVLNLDTIQTERDGSIAITLSTMKDAHPDECPPANAQRIVDCVNGCAGVENPSVVPSLVSMLREIGYWAAQVAQRRDIPKNVRSAALGLSTRARNTLNEAGAL